MRRLLARTSLRVRLTLGLVAAITAVSILSSAYYHASLGGLLERLAARRVATLARYIGATAELGVLATSPSMLAEPLSNALQQPDVLGVRAFGARGELIAAAEAPRAELPPWTLTQASCAPCELEPSILRWTEAVRRRAKPEHEFFAGQSEPAGEVAGYVVLDVSTKAQQAERRALVSRGMLISAAVLLLGVVITLILAQRLTAPLRALTEATRDIGKGKWSVAIPEGSPGELRELADDFRSMTRSLAELDAENRSYREQLEVKVAQRTVELQQAYEQMKELNAAKDQFVATVSHDFRSPLGIVLSCVQTVLADPHMPRETTASFLTRAERHCRRLQALVTNLLDLARIENRQPDLREVSLSDLLAECVESVEPSFGDRGIALSSRIEDGVRAHVDRVLLGQAIGNLLDNALKFTRAGGRVEVCLAREEHRLRVDVADDGPGIADADVPRLFEPFFQCEQDASRGEGSGLGLAIVAEVMRKHAGTVAVSTRLGKGTTFSLYVPREPRRT